jgi:hypothetical protein
LRLGDGEVPPELGDMGAAEPCPTNLLDFGFTPNVN